MVKSRSLAALGIAALGMTSAQAQTTDVALGIEALARRDVRAAEAAFRRGTTSDNRLIRPAAWQWLGHVAWKFRGDTTAAARYLSRALVDARDSSQILLEYARLNDARGRHSDAVRGAFDAMSHSLDAERRGFAARSLSQFAVNGAFRVGARPLVDAVGARMMAEVRDTLQSRVARFHGRTSDAIALIEIGAILGDSTALHRGLRSYFALTETPLPSPHDSVALIRGGLFEPLAILVERSSAGLLHAPDEAKYGRNLHATRKGVADIYRVVLSGRARPGEITRFLNGAYRAFWRDVSWKKPAFIPAEVSREIGQRYGAVVSIERSRGMDELFYAHRLGAYTVGGAPIVVLDGVVASGYDDWLLDGTGGRAGWVSNDTIYMRRTGFTETPFRALLALTDPQTMPGELFRITRDSIGDIDRARRDSLGYFPGVAARMFRSGAQALLDSVKTAEAFTRAMYDNLVRSTIHLHESRHRADARLRLALTEAEAEFRAKLDEVTGATLPRLALTAILSPSIGDSSPHGQANRRIMIGLNRWIRRNGASIAGYEARVPALLQLPLLTDAQLKAAFTSMRAR